ncbi:hypothetical protein SLA2020_051460 [Shorea laevis]
MKLTALLKFIKQRKHFGKQEAIVYTVEFQKRGLPHVHILLWVDQPNKPRTSEDVDKRISVEIPDKETNPELYELVKKFHIHNPCGKKFPNAPCMKNGKCSKGFPHAFSETTMLDKAGFPIYRRRNDGQFVEKNGVTLDNRWVVPYNVDLLQFFHAHIYVLVCCLDHSVKYLFKCITKGLDRTRAAITEVRVLQGNSTDEVVYDETKTLLGL